MAELQGVGPLLMGVGGIRGFGLTKEKKTPFKKTLKFPVPTGKGSVPHRNLFYGHETGQAEGSRKTCGRGFRAFRNKQSMSPVLSDSNLKVAGSDTRFLNLNGNNMMNDSLLQTSDDSMNSTSGLKPS